MSYRRRLFPILLAVALWVGVAAATMDAYKRVADKIVCQCGCHYPLDACPHTDCPWAPKLRAEIRAQVAAGKRETEILAGLVAQYGQVILAAPPAEGFNIVGWVLPFVALIAGLWVVRHILLTWRARQAPRPADPALVARYRKAIEKELESLEKS